MQGTENPGESGRGGKGRRRGEPEPPSDGKNSTLNLKGQSLGITQTAVRGMDQQKKLPHNGQAGNPGGQTYTHTHTHPYRLDCVVSHLLVTFIPAKWRRIIVIYVYGCFYLIVSYTTLVVSESPCHII